MALGKHLIVLALLALFVSVEAKGTLRVDNIVAIEAPIVVDALLGDVAEITGETAADQLGFGNFDTMRLNAPFLDFTASFLDVGASEDIDFQAEDGDLNLSARHSVDVNGDRINFNAGGDIAFDSSFGELSVVAGEEIHGDANSMSVTADAGGIAILSEGHDLTVEADNSLFILSDEATGVINVETSDDLHATGLSQVFVVADGDVDLNARGKLVFDATNSLSVVSSFGNVDFTAGDEVDIDVGGDFHVSSLDTSITSTTDGVELHGFVSTQLDSSNGRLAIDGNSKGVTFTAPSAPVSFTSTEDAVTFSAAGTGDQPGIYLRGSVDADLSGALVVEAGLNAEILGDSITFDAGSVDIEATNTVSSRTDDNHALSADNGSVTIEADEIILAATDFNDQSSELSVEAENINYAGDDMRIFGQEFDIEAGLDDFTITADNIHIDAHGGDVRDQEIEISATDAVFSGGDIVLNGGENTLAASSSATFGVASDVFISTRQDARDLVEVSGGSAAFVSSDGDFTVRDNLGSMNIHAEDNTGGDSSITMNTGDLELSAGMDQFRADIELEMTAHGTFSVSSVGGTTASDLNFAARDFVFQSSTSASFTAVGNLDVDAGTDLFLEADSVVATGNQNAGDEVSFTPDGYAYFVTRRDPATDDSVTIGSLSSLDFDVSDASFSSNGPATLGGGDDVIIGGNGITVTSNNFHPITFDMEGALNADIGDDLNIAGTHVTFDAATDLTLAMENDLEFESTERGYIVSSTTGDMTFTAVGDFTVESENGDIVSSNFSPSAPGGPITFTIDQDIDVTGDDLINVQSRDGDVSFSAGGNIDVSLGGDATISTGDSVSDVFNIDASATLTFTSSLGTTVTGAGPLVFHSGDDTTIFGRVVEFNSANGDVNIDGETSVTVTSAAASTLQGGAIHIEATETDVTVDGGSLFIENRDGFVATEEVFGFHDDLIFTATNGDITFDAPNGDMTFDSDFFGLTSEASSVTLNGDSFVLDSRFTRQDIAFVAEGEIGLTAENDITQFAAGDFSIVAANYTDISADAVLFSTEADLTMAAVQGSVLLNNTDGLIEFLAKENPNDSSPVEETTNIEFRANQEILATSTVDPIAFTSNGFSQFRINEDGGRATNGPTFNNNQFADTNGGLGAGPNGALAALASEPVGFTATTRHADGNIVLQSVFADVGISSDAQEWITNGASSVTAGDSITHVGNGGVTLAAKDGPIEGYALQGEFSLTLVDDINLLATGSVDILSGETVQINVNDAEITAHSADIIFETFLQNNIGLSSRDAFFTGGAKGVHVVPQGDLSATSVADTDITGNRGVFMSTNSGPLNITSETANNQGNAGDEILIHSGGDLLLSNGGNGNEDVRFNGVGVVFSTTQGPVQMTSVGQALFDAEAITLQSVGTSTTTRDRVLFDSNNNDFTVTGLAGHVDATELFSVGKTTTPDVFFTAGGNAATDGIDVNSAGNIDITSDLTIAMTPAGAFHSQSQSQASISAFGGVNIESTATDVLFESIGGTANFLASSSILTNANDIRLMSDGIMQLIQNSAADPIEFTIVNQMDVVSEGVLNEIVDETVTYTATTNDITINSDTNSGGHWLSFATSEDEIVVNAGNNVAHTSGDILDLTAGDDIVLTAAAQYDITTQGDFSDIGFKSLTDNVELVSETLATTGDRILFSALEDGTIELLVDDITLTATGGAAGGNSGVKGNILFDAVAEVEIDADTALFTIDESVYVLARDDVSLGVDIAPVAFSNGQVHMETEEHREGEITFTAPTLLSVTYTGNALFDIAETVQIGSGLVDMTTTAGDLLFRIDGPTANDDNTMEITSSTGFIFDPPGFLSFEAGSQRYAGNVEFNTEGASAAMVNNFSVRQADERDFGGYFYPNGGDDAVELSLSGNAVAVDSLNAPMLFQALGSPTSYVFDNVEEGQGYVELVAETTITQTAVTDITYQADRGGIAAFATTGMTFEATSFNATTQGIGAGIFFDSVDDIVFNSLNLVTAELAANNRLYVEAATSYQSTSTGGALDLFVGGPGTADDVGLKLATSPSSDITITSATTQTVTVDSYRVHADDAVSITSPSFALTAGDQVVLRNEGFNPDGDEMIISSTSTIDLISAQDLFVDAERDLDISATDITLTAATTPLFFRSSGDITLTNEALASSFTATGEMRFISEGEGIEFASTMLARTLTVGTDLNMISGVDETSNSVNFVATQGSSPLPSVTFGVTGAITNNVHNNYLSETSATTTITSTATDINFIARKGSQLFRSVTLDAFDPNEQRQLPARSTSVDALNGGIYMEAHYFIRHRQHQYLSFFEASGQTSHSQPSAPQQRTTNDMRNINMFTACNCSANVANCANVDCPETYNRVLQMQRALLDLGLLRF